MFWIAVGAPVLAGRDVLGAAAFLLGFYFGLIGSKVAIAAAIHAGRDRLLKGAATGSCSSPRCCS